MRWSTLLIALSLVGFRGAAAAETTTAPPTASAAHVSAGADAHSTVVGGTSAHAALPEGTFLADDGLRSFRSTYETWTRPGRRDPKYLRAALEMGAILAVGTAYYWIRPEINKQDWDFPDYQTRMQNFRPTFDTNLHVTNNVLHPGAGSLYYAFARLNGLNVPASIGYAIASGAAFEFFLEWLEKASYNDLVMTPMAGIPAGEFFVHLGDYFNSAPRGGRWTHKATSAVLGWEHHIHAAKFDPATRVMPPDSLGFSSYYWHRFHTLIGYSRTANDVKESAGQYDLALDAEIVSIPGFLRPGRFSLTFSDGDFTEGRARFSVSDRHRLSTDLFFSADLYGRYKQDIALVDGKPIGRGSMLALNLAARFTERRFTDRNDGYAMAHLFGPSFKLFGVYGDLVARLDGASNPDFAPMYSLAFQEWKAQFGEEGAKSALRQQGFYYAYGWSGRLRGLITWRSLELGTRAFLGYYGSIQGADRFPDKVTRDERQTDLVGELESWIGVTAPKVPFHVRAYVEHFGRRSTMSPVTVTRWDRRYGLLFGAHF